MYKVVVLHLADNLVQLGLLLAQLLTQLVECLLVLFGLLFELILGLRLLLLGFGLQSVLLYIIFV